MSPPTHRGSDTFVINARTSGPFARWRSGEVHFEASTEVLRGWRGTVGRRGKVATFPAGEVLAVATDTRTAIPQLVVSAVGQSLVLGPLWGIYPEQYEHWREWVEGRGWTVNDTYIEDPNSTRARPVRVSEKGVELAPQEGATQFVWGQPVGPARTSARFDEREDWLAADVTSHSVAFTSTLPGAQVRSVSVTVGEIPEGTPTVDFGGAASGAVISQGEVIAEVEFDAAVVGVAVTHAPHGRVELRFQRAMLG